MPGMWAATLKGSEYIQVHYANGDPLAFKKLPTRDKVLYRIVNYHEKEHPIIHCLCLQRMT